ncbi:MAG TPA: 5-formyltetrahydrofolate cyclo-ligase [Alphaproteobacteria bacterium]
MTIATDKATLRREALARRQAAAKNSAHAGESLRDRFLSAIPLPSGAVVSGFWPMGDEVDVRPLLQALVARGHPIALPTVVRRGAPLVFRAWRPGDALAAGTLGTSVPAADKPELRPQIVITPLLAFDACGFRVGYGAGYYDMTLAQLRAAGDVLAVGVGYDAQEVDTVPIEDWDQPLDWIVTERRALRVRR